MSLPALNPLDYTALHSLDFGSAYTPDGREHPINALTPVLVNTVSDVVSPDVPTAATVTTAGPCDQFTVGSFSWQRCMAVADVTSMATGATGAAGAPGNFLPASASDFFAKFMPAHSLARGVVILLAVGILLIVTWRLVR